VDAFTDVRKDQPPGTPARLPDLVTWLPLLRESLAQQGQFRWPLQGDSMRPTLPPDCEIVIVPISGLLPLGSLIVFAGQESALVAHRLVRRTKRYLVAQGDARWHPDPRLNPTQLLGRVVEATIDGRRIWPGRFELVCKWLWVGRAFCLWLLRRAWRHLRR
jgi:hypothetical protein